MFKKLLSLILVLSVCLTTSGCPKRSGKPYLNGYDGGADGMSYWTVKKNTDNFISFMSPDGSTALYPVRDELKTVFYTDGLCNIEPDRIYKITYDAQFAMGGYGATATFRAVYKCEEADIDNLFDNGFDYWPSFYNFLIINYMGTEDYLAFKNSKDGYDLYWKEYGKKHYDEARQIIYPFKVSDMNEPVELQFNVFCNNDLTDEYLVDCIVHQQKDPDRFVYVDDYHFGQYDGGKYVEKSDYQSIERAAVYYEFENNMFYIASDNISDERTRRLITYEDLTEKSAAELGLDEELYGTLVSDWKRTCTEVMRLKGEMNNWREYKYDVILFGGNIGKFSRIEYGKDFKLQLEESAYKVRNSEEIRYQYLAVYIRSEFNDWIPQD